MSSIVIDTPEVQTTTFQFFGEVHMYVERAGIVHATHEGFCLKCGETEDWIAEYTPLCGTVKSPTGGAYGARPGYITL